MVQTLRDWLKESLDKMVSIQTSIVGRSDADLVAYAWSGSQLRIHLIGEPVRTRAIKRTLQDATEIGVNTLFLVNANLIGKDGDRISSKDWLFALHELTHERIYTFRINEGKVEIIPIHLEEIKSSEERKVWYGPTVDFDRIRFYRTSIKQPRSVKGDWLVADFGNHAFWKNTDYRNYRTKKDYNPYHNRQTRWQTWSSEQTWQSTNGGEKTSNPQSQSPLKAYLGQCYEILGCEPDADREAVKRAYRKQALAFHPDTSNLPAEKAQAAFRALNEAYDYIKSARGWT